MTKLLLWIWTERDGESTALHRGKRQDISWGQTEETASMKILNYFAGFVFEAISVYHTKEYIHGIGCLFNTC